MLKNPYMPQSDYIIDKWDGRPFEAILPECCKCYIDLDKIECMYLQWEGDKPTKWVIILSNGIKESFTLGGGTLIWEALQQYKAKV